MSLLALTLSFALTQAAAEAPPPEAPPATPEERAALAAEKAALAAQKAAEAVARLADTLAPLPPPAAPAAEKKPDTWNGSVGAGFAFITGNSQTLTLTANIAADRRWENWALGIRVAGAYGLANPSANVSGSGSQTTARRANGNIRGDRLFGSVVSAFALASTEFDHMKNIESRNLGELGVGLTFFNRKEGDLEKLFFRLDLAMRAGYETRHQYFPASLAVDPYGQVILAPRGALAFRWAINANVRISEELEFIPYLLAPSAGRLLLNNSTKIAARVTENVSLTTGLIIQYDSQPPQAAPPPAPQRVTTDVSLVAGIEAAF